ncbi:excinuclease ABC subunit UvrA [Jiulongibacter sediminis]|uniref:UvrABC system protein A n=1 Tax=Jiulongibacter sediminis TaxID=1605367 RepID=A0A0P7BZ67_9BACT|nr:excinuclease ABC subunit UvrA [Jiulongibacter sediminis]KPM47491.1 excinuclease ABC subunit A [Jiulongibacter sediminis]TBX23284.1 excinuclease ABC subunit A [Jiulongibacter sediminis]
MTKVDISRLDPKNYIIIKGARVNNLKNVDVAIQRNKLTVVTGLSGSGKSSLAFDTLYAEGQRMYVESLSSYARQFLGRMEKPEVDYIRGVSPAIAIEQRVSTKNPRSTVGTTTEIYDYLKLLFARAGKTISPVSGKEVKKDTVTDVCDFIFSHEEGQKVMILTPLKVSEGRTLEKELDLLLKKGFNRVAQNGEIQQIEELLEIKNIKKSDQFEILIDRAVVRFDENNEPDEDTLYRISDSVQTAFFEGQGDCHIEILGKEKKAFSDRFEADGMSFEEPSVNLFTFNNPYGACKRCDGFGKVLGIDEDLVIPDKELSIFEGAIAPWRSERMSDWLAPLIKNGIRFDFPIHRSYKDLTDEQKKLVWSGNDYFEGLDAFFKDLEKQTYKVQYRVMLSRYRGRTICPECRGTRLRGDASFVKINDHSITDLVLMPVKKARDFFEELKLESQQEKISKRILLEVKNRLEYLDRVGLGYLTLNRLTSTLSGGEFQRIKLATSLGSALVGSMYILDEPSIGLHPRDTQKLVSVLESLRDLGNTVIVVEHEEEVMEAADEIIDIGPDAGNLGGELVFQGDREDIQKAPAGEVSHTIRFLKGEDKIEIPKRRRKAIDFLNLTGASENNLKNVDVKFPLNVLSVVTGVSGSGKSTLVRKILYPALAKIKGEYSQDSGKYKELTGSISRIERVEMVDQNPIGKSSRSNPVTYIKAYDAIRALMADQPLAKQRDYKPAFFSFNVDGGRCEACAGEGEQTIEMQFMADVKLTCESCKGKRFKQEVLEVKYNEKDISDILDMTIDEALEFFKESQPKLYEKLLPLQDVGLGYIRLGQSSNTLSGGEAQRVKLAFFLGKGNSDKGKTLFIFDEPTTGLHFHDIQKLLKALNELIEQGDSVLIIEHNMEVIKSADWIIDLGPEGGEEGGYICFEGTPEEMAKIKGNYTADFLREKL